MRVPAYTVCASVYLLRGVISCLYKRTTPGVYRKGTSPQTWVVSYIRNGLIYGIIHITPSSTYIVL